MRRSTRRVPGYLLEAELGRGASGEVWRARVAATGASVAVKWIPLTSPEQARAARSEAAMLQTLDHPHLVRLHDVVPVPDALVLVLDLAEGGTLADLVGARGAIAPGEAVAALSGIGAALAVAHAAGVVHGDVTPANVLFTEIALPLLADLGVARIIGERRPARSTPAFVDPAIANGGTPSPSTDVFMAAATTLYALTGAPLWPGPTADHALEQARHGRLDRAARLADPRVPEPVGRVLGVALDPDPGRRGTAAGFALELRHAAEPCAIELTAGRVLRPGATTASDVVAPVAPAVSRTHRPRHAAVTATSAAPRVDERARPAFARPTLSAPLAPELVTMAGGGGAERSVGVGTGTALTHGVRARPVALRPPRPPRRRRVLRVAVIALLVALISGAATVAVRTWLGRGRASSAAVASAHDKGPAPPPPDATAQALTRLAALRTRAFATRDVALLAQVYVPGPLLDADVALLQRIVPVACGLVGANTRYGVVSTTGSPARRTVTATAALSASRLVCAGQVRGQAAGTPATVVRIELVQTAAGLRITALHAG